MIVRNTDQRSRDYSNIASCFRPGHADYTFEEKKIIFSKFALPKVLKRIGLKENECIITEDGLDAVIEEFKNTSGIRDLEQAAEHLAANALYRIEVDHVPQVTFDAEGVRHLFL